MSEAPETLDETLRRLKKERDDADAKYNAALTDGLVPNGCHLDDVLLGSQPHLQRGVVEIAPSTALRSGGDEFKRTAVQTHAVSTGSERQPVEIDGCAAPFWRIRRRVPKSSGDEKFLCRCIRKGLDRHTPYSTSIRYTL